MMELNFPINRVIMAKERREALMRKGQKVGVAILAAGTVMAMGVPALAKAHPLVHKAVIKVGGKKTVVLEAANGRTLYYYTKNTATHSACTGACLGLWPPYKVKSAPAHINGLPGKFTVFKGQLEYEGHQLYMYSGDKGPGQSHGEGLFHAWWVAAPKIGSPKAAKGGGGGTGGGGGW
jgi:predicted lipoprotein with Yx(FWY)xxD motif